MGASTRRVLVVLVALAASLLVPGPATGATIPVTLNADKQTAAPGEVVTFQASGQFGANAAFFWQVDGADVPAQGSSYSTPFQSPGTHTVQVTVQDGNDIGQASRSVQVQDPQPNHPPTVTVDPDKSQVSPGEQVTFTAHVTDPDPQDSAAITWYVDGTASQERAATLTTSFADPGTHSVRVVAVDLSGASGEASTSVAVSGGAPNASIAVRTAAPKTRSLTVIDASGSTPANPGATVVKWAWDLNGNGTFETDCGGPFAAVHYAGAGDHTVSVKVTDSTGGTSPAVTVTIPVAASAADSKYAAGALNLTAGGCGGAGNDGTVPDGGSAEDMTCYKTVRTGIAEAMSPCFRLTREAIGDGPKALAKEIYTSRPTVRLNGIDVVPASGGTIRIDSWTHEVSSTGGKARARLDAGSVLGKLTFFIGTIKWKLPAGKDGRFNLGKVSITEGAELFGLSVEGDASLDLVRYGAELPVWIHLPSPLDVSATVTMRTDNLKGLRLDSVHLRVKNATFGAFAVNDLDLLYNPAASQFDGFADLSLTSVGNLKVTVQVIGKTLTMFAADFTPEPPLALGAGVFLQHIDFTYDAGPPLTLLGGVKLTAGPPVNGTAAAAIDGRLKFVASDPWLLRADGSAAIAGFGVANAFLQYQSNGMIRLGGDIDANLAGVVSAKAKVDFWLYTPTGQFNAQGSADVCVWKGCGGGAVVVSSTGIGGCIYTFFADFGMGYKWGGGIKTYLTGCDINHWATAWDGDPSARLAPHSRRAAVAQEDMQVKAGEKAVYFRFASTDDPPQVVVKGPDGTRIEVPAGTENFVQNDRYIIVQVPPQHATYVIVNKPAAGRWTVETADGSPGLVAVGQASALPTPKVTASVGGRGRQRTLTWKARPAPGQTIELREQAGRMSRRIALVKATTGTVRFAPGPGPAGTRRIVAVVQRDGVPRAQLDVASYKAPGPVTPARTQRVALKRTATSATATWPTAAHAARWKVVVAVSDGRRFTRVQTGRTFVVPRVFRAKTVRVTVRGLSAQNVLGPARTGLSRGR
jgi:hypothetical protein